MLTGSQVQHVRKCKRHAPKPYWIYITALYVVPRIVHDTFTGGQLSIRMILNPVDRLSQIKNTQSPFFLQFQRRFYLSRFSSGDLHSSFRLPTLDSLPKLVHQLRIDSTSHLHLREFPSTFSLMWPMLPRVPQPSSHWRHSLHCSLPCSIDLQTDVVYNPRSFARILSPTLTLTPKSHGTAEAGL